MKILVLTRSAWDDSNSTGNTMSNLFEGYNPEKIANLYFRDEPPNNDVCYKYFTVSDIELLKSFIEPKKIPGRYFINIKGDKNIRNESKIYKKGKMSKKIYSFFRGKKLLTPLIGQNLLWKIGNWDNENLNEFLEEFSPDIIFSPSFHTIYTHKILWYVQKKTNAKVALFHADDYLEINPAKSYLRKKYEKYRSSIIRKSIDNADLNYCISEKQCKEYEKNTKNKMKLLFKGADFSQQLKDYIPPSDDFPIEIIYIGSVLYGRWKTLAKLAQIIKQVNQEKDVYKLKIYSQYELTQEMKDHLIIKGVSDFLGKISPLRVREVNQKADILLHVESFDEIEKRETRLSFSTKIVDYLNSGKPVMAIGWSEAASIEYLRVNDAAFTATDEKEISTILNKIQYNPILLQKYACNAWNLGKKNHQITDIQKGLYKDFRNILSKKY